MQKEKVIVFLMLVFIYLRTEYLDLVNTNIKILIIFLKNNTLLSQVELILSIFSLSIYY